MSDSITKLLDSIERVKADLKLKDVLISEMYLQHIEERQEVKKEYFVQRRLLEQKHEEESIRYKWVFIIYMNYITFRIESDILKIKAEMGTMEKQLSGLMTKSDNSVQNSMKNVKIEQVIKDSLVHV